MRRSNLNTFSVYVLKKSIFCKNYIIGGGGGHEGSLFYGTQSKKLQNLRPAA